MINPITLHVELRIRMQGVWIHQVLQDRAQSSADDSTPASGWATSTARVVTVLCASKIFKTMPCTTTLPVPDLLEVQRHALVIERDEDGRAPHIEPVHVRSEDALPAQHAWRPSTALKWVRHRCWALMSR